MTPGLDDKNYKNLKRSNDCLTLLNRGSPLWHICVMENVPIVVVSLVLLSSSINSYMIYNKKTTVCLFVHFLCVLPCLYLDLRFMITPLVSSTFSSKLELHVHVSSGFRKLAYAIFVSQIIVDMFLISALLFVCKVETSGLKS